MMISKTHTIIPEPGGYCAIYARYSMHLQNETSLDDQIFQCKNRAKELKLKVRDDLIFTDAAISGLNRNRKGFNALIENVENGVINTVIIDDLSRISRNVVHILSIASEFKQKNVRFIALADGFDNTDKNSKIPLLLKAVVNEICIDDIRSRTKRGQDGLLRKKLVFWRVYGYELVQSNKHIRPDGKPYIDSVVDEEKAHVILKIFKQYITGYSLRKIAKALNEDNIPSPTGKNSKWSCGTIKRILNNKIYTGTVIWGRNGNYFDHKSSRRKQYVRNQKDWTIYNREDLRIVPETIFKQAQNLLCSRNNFVPSNDDEYLSYANNYPKSILSGNIICGICHGTIGQYNGTRDGYYACLKRKNPSCSNLSRIQRRKIEIIILAELMDVIFTSKCFHYLVKHIEKEIKKIRNIIPEILHKKNLELKNTKKKIDRLMEFIEKTDSPKRKLESVAESITFWEKKKQKILYEINNLQKKNKIRNTMPPKEWIIDVLSRTTELLELDTINSAMILREILGKIIWTPKKTNERNTSCILQCSLFSITIDKKTKPTMNWLNGLYIE